MIFKKNDASIILKGKAFQNPSSVSCLEGIPDFRSLPPLPLLPKFKAGSKISYLRRILYLAVLQFHTALKTSFPLEAVIFGQIEEPRFYLILIAIPRLAITNEAAMCTVQPIFRLYFFLPI